ncbi:hypothetical protein F443_12478, partial [Phytophthora nicotianae P1569]
MVRILKPFSAVIATMLCLGLATADTATVSVLGDATYTIPSSRGKICKGTGAYPSGTACPLKGDGASGGCREGLPSYKHGKCVAPKVAQCVLVSDKTWGCAYPKGGTNPKTDYPKSDYPKGDYPKGDYPKNDYEHGDYPKGDYAKGDYPVDDYSEGEKDTTAPP